MGVKLPENKSSRKQKFPRTVVPGSEHARKRIDHGVKGPGSESSRERIGQGAKRPGSESATEQIGQGPIGRFTPGRELVWERKGSVPIKFGI